jgi:flagellar assembly protein FliH
MSFRARRVSASVDVQPFDWGNTATGLPSIQPLLAPQGKAKAAAAEADPPPAPAPDPNHQARLAALERDAFAKGYEQGERAGAEAGAKRAEAMLRRLAQTLDELADVRRAMIHQTERQMVQLAMAIAKRVVRREVAIDRELTLTMARVALDRLGDSTSVTVHLHPDDFNATVAGHDSLHAGSRVTVVADPGMSRGGCRVESDFGYVDASVDAQFHELARALLADEGQEAPAGTHGR